MKPRRLSVLALALLVTLAGCDKKQDNPVAPTTGGTGTILLTVMNAQGDIVPNATVITNPKIGAGDWRTDGLGQVLFESVPAAVYTIAATRSNIGSARDVAEVSANAISRLSLHLVAGVFLEPQIRIFRPVLGFPYSKVDSLNLVGSVSDIQDRPENLTLRWSSSVDGVLSTAHADADGITRVLHGPVVVGDRWVVLRATNSQGLVGAESVFVSVRSFNPAVTLFLPSFGAGYRPGDNIAFSAQASDRETPNASLNVTWRSSLDGVLNSGPPQADGTSSFSSSTLSRGVHFISVTVTDGDGNKAADSVQVHNDLPQSAVLQSIAAQPAGILLTWTAPVEPQFAEFHIYRAPSAGGPFTLINVITDPAATQYQDISATLGVTYYYRVGLETSTGAESQSNVKSGVAGVFINMGVNGVDDIVVDPVRPYLYAIDRVNNSVVFVSTDSLKVTKKIFIGSQPTDIDIDKAGNELFVANFGSTEIAVVDLNTQTKTRSLLVDAGGIWDGNPYRITCLTQGRLAWTSLDQWNSIRLIDTQTGVRFGSDFGTYYQPELVSNADGTHFFVCESGLSGSNVYRLDFPGDALAQTDLTPGYGYSYSNRLVAISGDGNILFYAGKKINANHLATEMGTFSELTYAANLDGSLVIGSTRIFDGNTFAAIATLPISGSLKKLAADGHTLYTYDVNSNRIYVLDANALVSSQHSLRPSLLRPGTVRAASGGRRTATRTGN